MRSLFAFYAAILIVIALGCNSKGSSSQKTPPTSSTQTQKGNIPVSEDGYYMKAKIDGKPWAATSMLADDKNDSRRVQGENDNNEAIGFYVWMKGLEQGTIRKFGDGNAADLFTNDDVITWNGKKGELLITKINSDVMEGTFYFTATSTRSAKTIEVTDGSFRFVFAKK